MTIRFRVAIPGSRVRRCLIGAGPAIVLAVALAGCGAPSGSPRPADHIGALAAATPVAPQAVAPVAPVATTVPVATTSPPAIPPPAQPPTGLPAPATKESSAVAVAGQAAAIDAQLRSIDNEINASNSGLSGNEGTPGQ